MNRPWGPDRSSQLDRPRLTTTLPTPPCPLLQGGDQPVTAFGGACRLVGRDPLGATRLDGEVGRRVASSGAPTATPGQLDRHCGGQPRNNRRPPRRAWRWRFQPRQWRRWQGPMTARRRDLGVRESPEPVGHGAWGARQPAGSWHDVGSVPGETAGILVPFARRWVDRVACWLVRGVGSGKSSVALAARGAVIIDADAIARSVLAPGS